MCGLLRTVCTSRGVTTGVSTDMEPGLSLARLQAMHAWHAMGMLPHALTLTH